MSVGDIRLRGRSGDEGKKGGDVYSNCAEMLAHSLCSGPGAGNKKP